MKKLIIIGLAVLTIAATQVQNITASKEGIQIELKNNGGYWLEF